MPEEEMPERLRNHGPCYGCEICGEVMIWFYNHPVARHERQESIRNHESVRMGDILGRDM